MSGATCSKATCDPCAATAASALRSNPKFAQLPGCVGIWPGCNQFSVSKTAMSEGVIAAPTIAAAEHGEAAVGAAEPTAGAAAPAHAGTAAPAAAEPVAARRITLTDNIARMKLEQARLKAERMRVMKELKNATKRKNRLKRRARMLTDNDLVEVITMRAGTTAAVMDGTAVDGSTETVSPSAASASSA